MWITMWIFMAQKEKYLWKRGGEKGLYSFQLAVPRDLRGQFKLNKIVEPLKTDSLSEARKLAAVKHAQWQMKFERARQSAELTAQEINKEAATAYQDELDQLEKIERRTGNSRKIIDDDGRSQAEVNLDWLDQNQEALEDGDWSSVSAEISAIERRRLTTIDPASPTYATLAEAILLAQRRAMGDMQRFLHNEPMIGFPKASNELPPRPKPISRGSGPRFMETVELLIAEQTRDKGASLRQGTIGLHRKVYRLFVEHCGDLPINAVTRATASEFLTNVGAERKLLNRSLNQYAVTLSAAFAWMIKTGRLEGANPFAGLGGLPVPKGGWVPYNDRELAKLFGSELFSRPIDKPLPWVMLIGLYSGLRLNEICQLKVADLRKEHGVWLFDIKEGDGQILKTHSATRLVPVHSELVTAGLLKYARGLPADGWLFPSLKGIGPDAKRSWYLGQRFTHYRRGLGIERERLTFHSLRKNFTSALDRAGVPQADAAALLGHSRGFSWDVYSSGPGLKDFKTLWRKWFSRACGSIIRTQRLRIAQGDNLVGP
jgi:integrase